MVARGAVGSAAFAGRPGTRRNRGGDAGEEAVGAGTGDERHARRQPIAAAAAGNRDCAKIEQVDEVGVGPEPGIEPHGIGFDLGDGIEARHRRNDHRVEFRPGAARSPLPLGEPIQRLEGRNGVKLPRALDDRAGDGMKGFRIGLDQRLGRGIALGHPRSVVEHAGDLGEGLEVELDDAGAERLSEPNVLREGGRGVVVVEELKLIRAGNAKPNPARERRKGGLAERAAVSVAFVESDRQLERP